MYVCRLISKDCRFARVHLPKKKEFKFSSLLMTISNDTKKFICWVRAGGGWVVLLTWTWTFIFDYTVCQKVRNKEKFNHLNTKCIRLVFQGLLSKVFLFLYTFRGSRVYLKKDNEIFSCYHKVQGFKYVKL